MDSEMSKVLIYQVPEDQQMHVVEMHLEGRAEIWYQSTKLARGSISWEEFCVDVSRRFGDTGLRDEVEEFNKLQQNGSVRDYQDKFEELRSGMLLLNPTLPESYFISSFISGVKEEIKPMLRLMKPATLLEAFEIAMIQEQSVDIWNRRNKIGVKPAQEGPKSTGSAAPPTKQLGNPIDRGKPTTQGEFKKLTPQEIQFRRNNHLCFKCGEKFTVGHQCKFVNLHFMVAEEEEEEFQDAPGEQDEHTGNPGKPIDVSVYALSCAIQRKTITLQGQLKGETVSILVDTGSSHSFINPTVLPRQLN